MLPVILRNGVTKHVLSAAKELMRSFTEFTLRQKGRPFVSLRVTDGEGFRMTLRVRFFAFAQNDNCLLTLLLSHHGNKGIFKRRSDHHEI